MRDRTADLFRAREALSQLSYSPLTGLLCAALRCNRRSVSHILVRMLPPSLLMRLNQHTKSCVTLPNSNRRLAG